MSYVIEKSCVIGTGTEKKIDEQKFAADLAKALGGTVEQTGFQNESVYIIVGDVKLFVRADNWKKRVEVSVSCVGMSYNDFNLYDNAQKTQSATVNPEARSIELIAKDIKKRVIDANQPALAARRAYVAAKKEASSNVAKIAAELAAAGIDVRLDSDNSCAQLYTKGTYLSARLESHGKISIDRVESMSPAKFLRIVAILKEKA
jgi:hypothetical protein